MTLSYFHESNKYDNNTLTNEDRIKAKEAIKKKRAELDATLRITYQGDPEPTAIAEEPTQEQDEEDIEVQSSSDNSIHDNHVTLEADKQEYDMITGIFKKNKIKYNEKRMKHALFYNNNLPEEVESKLITQDLRYPKTAECLMVNPFPKEKKKGKKKKKK